MLIRVTTLLAAFLFFTNTSYPVQSNALASKLSTPVRNYRLEAPGFVNALVKVAGDFKIPMGIEWVESQSGKSPVVLFWESATGQQVIETIVKGQPDYQLRVEGGIVHVSPRKPVAKDENFLWLRINEFTIKNLPTEVASRKLREIVRMRVSSRQGQPTQKPGGVAGSLLGTAGEPNISIHLQNTTAREILDTLARAATKNIWVVTFLEDTKVKGTGFRRTRTMWNEAPILDEEQPVWDMLRWGQHFPNTKGSN